VLCSQQHLCSDHTCAAELLLTVRWGGPLEPHLCAPTALASTIAAVHLQVQPSEAMLGGPAAPGLLVFLLPNAHPLVDKNACGIAVHEQMQTSEAKCLVYLLHLPLCVFYHVHIHKKQRTHAVSLPMHRCKEVCLDRIESGATYDPSEPISERNINHRQLYTDLDLFQVCMHHHMVDALCTHCRGGCLPDLEAQDALSSCVIPKTARTLQLLPRLSLNE